MKRHAAGFIDRQSRSQDKRGGRLAVLLGHKYQTIQNIVATIFVFAWHIRRFHVQRRFLEIPVLKYNASNAISDNADSQFRLAVLGQHYSVL